MDVSEAYFTVSKLILWFACGIGCGYLITRWAIEKWATEKYHDQALKMIKIMSIALMVVFIIRVVIAFLAHI